MEPSHLGARPAPGPVTSAPLAHSLAGGGQVPGKAQEAAPEEAQHHDEAQREDGPGEGQERALNKNDGVDTWECPRSSA